MENFFRVHVDYPLKYLAKEDARDLLTERLHEDMLEEITTRDVLEHEIRRRSFHPVFVRVYCLGVRNILAKVLMVQVVSEGEFALCEVLHLRSHDDLDRVLPT